jgi:thymidylate synthase
LIARHGDPERLRWMRANFASRDRVEALGGARSYASRLFDYAGSGRDQVAWVIDRLRSDPASRSATITTFEPMTDTTYIPCVSLLDFWVRDGALELAVYAHFGTKGYGNLTELALLQEQVAEALGRPVGVLRFIVKSAHIYDTERAQMLGVVAGEPERLDSAFLAAPAEDLRRPERRA